MEVSQALQFRSVLLFRDGSLSPDTQGRPVSSRETGDTQAVLSPASGPVAERCHLQDRRHQLQRVAAELL